MSAVLYDTPGCQKCVMNNETGICEPLKNNPLKGLDFVGHLLPAIPLYAMAWVTMLWGYNVHPRLPWVEKYVSGAAKRNDYIQLLVALITGVVYASIHFSIVVTACSDKEFMDNLVHTNIGVALAIGGTLHWLFCRPYMDKLSVNFGLPLVFITIGFAIGFHQDHVYVNKDGVEMEDMASNMIHTSFGLCMMFSGAMIAIGAKWPRWQVIEGIVHMLSASLLTVSTHFFIDGTRDRFGVGNLLTACVWFSVAHALGIGLFVHFSGKARNTEVIADDDDSTYSQVDTRETLEETPFDDQKF